MNAKSEVQNEMRASQRGEEFVMRVRAFLNQHPAATAGVVLLLTALAAGTIGIHSQVLRFDVYLDRFVDFR